MEYAPQKVRGFIGLAIGIWKYQLQGTLPHPSLMLVQGVQQSVTHGNRARAALSLRQTETPSIKCSPDVNQPTLEVDVRPLKAEQFRNAHSRDGDREDQSAVWFYQLI